MSLCGSQFADMPVVSESGCSGGGRESIPAGQDESMQRERGGGREGARECNITQVKVPFHFHNFDRKRNIKKHFKGCECAPINSCNCLES